MWMLRVELVLLGEIGGDGIGWGWWFVGWGFDARGWGLT